MHRFRGTRASKRLREKRSDGESSGSAQPSRIPSGAHGLGSGGRGRPITTGKCARAKHVKADARAMLMATSREVSDTDAEELAVQYSKRIQRAKERAQFSARELTADKIAANILKSVEAIIVCVNKCKNIKGTIQGTFKDAASAIAGATEEMRKRTSNEEVRRLSAAKQQLQQELADLKKEFQELKATGAPPSPCAAVPSSGPGTPGMGDAILARLEFLENRVLRPSLAADRREAAPAAKPPTTEKPSSSVLAVPRRSWSLGVLAAGLKKPAAKTATRGKTAPTAAKKALAVKLSTAAAAPTQGQNGAKKRAKALAPKQPAPREPRPLPLAPASMDADWSEVVKRGRRKVIPARPAPAGKPVQIKLNPDAVRDGFTFARYMQVTPSGCRPQNGPRAWGGCGTSDTPHQVC